jgi:hypothetical protein
MNEKMTQTTKLSDSQLKQRRLAPLKSGAYAFLRSGLIRCEYCLFGKDLSKESKCACELVKNFQEDRIEEINDLPQIREQDLPIIVSLVREETLQMIISNWLGKVGLLNEKSKHMEYQPILKLWYLSINASNRMRDSLGLSPQSRAKLGVATAIGFDFAKRMQDLEKEGIK